MASLFVIRGNDQGLRYQLTGPVVRIGRDADNTIQLRDQEVSRHHALLRCEGEQWVLEDCGSSNGTFVNSRPVQRHVLRSGDQIQLGRTLLLFTAQSPATASSAQVQIRPEPPEDQSRILHTVVQEQGSRILHQALMGREGSAYAESLRLVYETARMAAHTLNLEQLLRRILQLVFEFVHADRGCVLLMDTASGKLEPCVQISRGSDSGQMIISQTILDYVLQRREGVLTTNAQADMRWTPTASIRQLGIREAICVPMLGRYGLVGAMYIDTAAPVGEVLRAAGEATRFTPDHLTLMMAVAHQAALAVEDTRFYQAMVRAERLAAIGQAIATLSHHIKNILQGIRGGSFLIKDGLARGDQNMVRQGWQFVEKNQERISNLVLNMLSFSKERRAEPTPGNLNQLVHEVVELARGRTQDQTVQLKFHPHPDLPTLMFDPDAIHQALLNVVMNAVEACAAEGKGQVEVRVLYDPQSQQATVEVSDTGPGIPPEKLESIFEPFVSTKGNRGTGLGLPVTRKLLREHGGDVSVESQLGRGSIFRLWFPAPEAREQSSPSPAAKTSQAPTDD